MKAKLSTSTSATIRLRSRSSTEGVAPAANAPEDLETRLLLEGVYLGTGYDFRNYNRALIKRRLLACMRREKLKSLSGLQAIMLRDPQAVERLVELMGRRSPALFRNPGFFHYFRQEIVPWLKTYSFSRLWVAGCGSGADAYSISIVIAEAGLAERCRIYATDLSEGIVRRARGGRLPLAQIQPSAEAYEKSGGAGNFSDYYQVKGGEARLVEMLSRNLVFAAHNLVTDASFNEFHVIVCREAMREFDPLLQTQVHDLFFCSLMPRGLLALGGAADLSPTLRQIDYEPLHLRHGIYRKKWQ